MTERRVYVPEQASPEVTAHALALYSRSPLSLADSLTKMNEEKSRKFHEKFYLGYGHKSIADMAVVTLAMEQVSILAAITIEDEQLWAGQERSTRYQTFDADNYVVPPEIVGTSSEPLYRDAVSYMLTGYTKMLNNIVGLLGGIVERPEDMESGLFVKKLNARALDMARMLLPYGTATSVGQITSARSLEGQISRLMSSNLAEINAIATEMKAVVTEGGAAPAPALVKHATHDTYRMRRDSALREHIDRILGDLEDPNEYNPDYDVQLIQELPLELELVTTLMYRYSTLPYNQLAEIAKDLPSNEVRNILQTSFQGRSDFDGMAREHQSGYTIGFDVKAGGKEMQDFYRHRRMTQIRQEITELHGYEYPLQWFFKGLPRDVYADPRWERIIEDMVYLMDTSFSKYEKFADEVRDPDIAAYALPVAFKQRALFKMDFAQAAYIIETRSAPGAHFNCRVVANSMHRLLKEKYPLLTENIRNQEFEEVDLLNR